MAAGTSPDIDEDAVEGDGRWFGSLGSILYLLTLTWAAAIASFPIHDNSFFTHLATGRIILDERSVPSVDPYTFTAEGTAWTVQSWLASVAYAGVERLGGVVGIRVLVLVVFVVAMSLFWALTAPARSVLPRVALVGAGLLAVTELWSERPYMVGVIGLATTWLALAGRVPPWVCAPLLWVWVNSHGSFPLCFGLIMLVAIGAWLDQRYQGVDAELDVTRSVAKWSLIGLAASLVNPVGIRLLVFPLKALTQSQVLAQIVEWNPPEYDSIGEKAYLVLFLAGIASVAHVRRWRLTLPLIVFGGAAMYAQRNLVMSVMVCVAVVSMALPELGSLRSGTRPRLGAPLTIIVGLLAGLVAVVAVSVPLTTLDAYPARALAFEESYVPIDGRLATQDFTGNLLEALDGPRAGVFIDDRADMYPEAVMTDYIDLLGGGPEWRDILDRNAIVKVVWERQKPLASILAESPDWAVVYSDVEWMVACRRTTC